MLLLDTQLVLWLAFEPDRLSTAARQLLSSREQALAFSHASLWEVTLKSSLGREDFSVDTAGLRRGLIAQGLAEVAIRPEHLFEVSRLPWHHRDPFDRLLVAQAWVESFTLATADNTLLRYGPWVRVL